MILPKYLRPIRDVEAHGLTRLEKTVRMIVFAPLLMLFMAPTALVIVFVGMLGYLGIMLLMNGAGNIVANPAEYSFEAMLAIALLVLIIFSNIIGRTIRRYFLPFG